MVTAFVLPTCDRAPGALCLCARGRDGAWRLPAPQTRPSLRTPPPPRAPLTPGRFPPRRGVPAARPPSRAASVAGSARRSASRRRPRGPAWQPGHAPRRPVRSAPTAQPLRRAPRDPGPARLPMVAAPRAPCDWRARSPGRRTFSLRRCFLRLGVQALPSTCVAGGARAGQQGPTLGGGGIAEAEVRDPGAPAGGHLSVAGTWTPLFRAPWPSGAGQRHSAGDRGDLGRGRPSLSAHLSHGKGA